MSCELVGAFAISRSGHDKGETYVIVGDGSSAHLFVSGPAAGKRKPGGAKKSSKTARAVSGECPSNIPSEAVVFVANGKGRTLQLPKRKNLRHLDVARQKLEGVPDLLKGEPVSSNLKLAAAIKAFRVPK